MSSENPKHLLHSHHVPLDSREPSLAHLPLDREIIAYCRGRYCIPSLKAVRTLRANGFQSRRLEEGVAEWKATGELLIPACSPYARPQPYS